MLNLKVGVPLKKIFGQSKIHLKSILLSSKALPIILICTILAMLFVLFRMKSVELDYEIINANEDLKRIRLENKELKAQKAKQLSIKKLRELARKYDLARPKKEQIIVIP